MFYQSLISDWNHGNAHFLRGVATELIARGHQVEVYEPRNSWSVQCLTAENGYGPLLDFSNAYPVLVSHRYDVDTLELGCILGAADLVIVHEWNDDKLIETIGEHRAASQTFRLVFHDTHHRLADSNRLPFTLKNYDGVLAYGEVIKAKYLRRGWTERAWTWHEAADVRIFHPDSSVEPNRDLVWVGNWGDDERSAELYEFLINPVKDLELRATVYGVGYPDAAMAALTAAKISYGGWLPNYKVPAVFAAARATVHIPRKPYVRALPGVPTIRPFEALACGIPLVSSPWSDTEGLFTAGKDFLIARSGEEMRQHLREILNDHAYAQELVAHGLNTIRKRHTCAHRVDELLGIYQAIAPIRESALAAI
jgi:spore maturation protein CgeB